MRNIILRALFLLITLVACRAITPDTTFLYTPTPKTPTVTQIVPSATIKPTPTATLIPPTLMKTSTPNPPTPTENPTQIPIDFTVRTHPDAGLFIGDQVSFEILAPLDLNLKDNILQMSDGKEIALETSFAPFGIGGRNQATIYWGWDTTNFEAGMLPLQFSIQPLGYTWTHTVTLGTSAEIPPPEPIAQWATDESDCCVFYYITETAAAREITSTLLIADTLAENTVDTLEIEFTEPLVVTLMPRVLGQGGFASSEMYISFLDRNYAGNSLEMVLQHEMVHILDQRLGGRLRPSILIEGLAVYLSGGHYKPEELIPRAAALLHPDDRKDGIGLDWYLPLRSLVDDFYNSQHEIGYIQAGALVEFMVDTWGWETYSAFYRDINPIENGSQSDALDASLKIHFGLTLEELEGKFLKTLGETEITVETMEDVQLTVSFFDTMRRYQQILDPSAYFLTAWLPNGPLMREKGIVADLVRHPSEVENLALETLLATAIDSLRNGDLEKTKEGISAVNSVLDALEDGGISPFDAHPLAKSYYEITLFLKESGYQVERVDLADGTAQVIASQGWPDLTYFEFKAIANRWTLVNNQ